MSSPQRSAGELARVAALRALFSREAPGIQVGIGDDAAVLDAAALTGSIVWTVDAQVDGTHFRTDWLSWEDVGYRSFMAAASDLAAMGAEPVAALSALVLAVAVDDAALDAIARGQAAASDLIGAPVIGGNLARGVETSITTTLLGRVASPVLRSGAQPGDGLWLAGAPGLAGAGLAFLQNARMQNAPMQDAHVQDASIAACLQAWRRPVARMAQGRALAGAAHAAIDLSDGLAHDAWQLAAASDVRLVLDGAAVLQAAGATLTAAAAVLGREVLDLVLYGGEDYALLAASKSPLEGFVRIGTVHAPEGAARVLIETPRGIEPVEPRGYDHFAT